MIFVESLSFFMSAFAHTGPLSQLTILHQMHASLLEQVGEGLAGVGGGAGGCLALDHGAHGEEFARVARVFIHDARSDCLTAFETRTRIEVITLPAGMKLCFALLASALRRNARRRLCSAHRALHRLTKRHHPRRTWPFTILRPRLRLRLLRLASLRLAVIIHITALTIFPVTHLFSSGWLE